MEKKSLPSKEHLEFVKQVLKENNIDLQFELSICLSDIPKEKMQKSSKGKIYVDIVASLRKEPDQWGRDLKVIVRQTQKDREQNLPKDYVGGGRMITFAMLNNNSGVSDDELKEVLPF